MWEIARPGGSGRAPQRPGVDMTGFVDRGALPPGLRLVPHPAVTLVLDFGTSPITVDDDDDRTHAGSLAAGVGVGGVSVRSDSVRCVQVRLSPVMASAVVGVPPLELAQGVLSLDDAWGPDAVRLRDQLDDATSWSRRFAIVDALLVRRLEARRAVDREVAWAWDRIVASRGQVRVGALAEETGWSRTRLWSRFRSQVGITPKRAASLVRFDHAARRLASGDRAARVAADAGYADQSHLHRDVRAFTGATPSALARAPWLAVDDIAWPQSRTFVQDGGA